MTDSPQSSKHPPRQPDARWAPKLLAASIIFLAVITAWIIGASWLAVTAKAASDSTAHITATAAFVAAVLGMGWLVRRYIDIAVGLLAASPLPNRWRAWRSRRQRPHRQGPPQEWL